jgi:hypothetical protein
MDAPLRYASAIDRPKQAASPRNSAASVPAGQGQKWSAAKRPRTAL